MPESEPDTSTFDWSPQIDELLASWCDKAKCFEWMHTEAYSLFDKRSKTFMITVNCMTAVAGLSNVIAGGSTINGFQLAWVFGGISIAASTLNMLQDKLGYQASSHLHLKLASDWCAIKAKIEEVVSIPYSGRKDCKTIMRFIKDDIGKASSANSMIPEHIRVACYDKFSKIPAFDIPDICGQMEHTHIFVRDALLE